LGGGARRGGRWLIAFALAAMLLPRPARAEDRDSATVGKITLLNRKAVDAYQHLEFETAVKLLNEALEVSERAGLTLHPIRARTFVTLGIVTLGGYKQRDQAIKYFHKALQIQPEVRLSAGLANPEIQAAFDEAIVSLANGASDELPPDKALVHEPVHVGQVGRPVPIRVLPDKDLGASVIVLRYRAATAAAFADLPLQKGPSGAFEAAIPASATTGQQVVYFIEARRADGSVIVRRGAAADPMVVALVEAAKPAVAVTAPLARSARASRRFYFALLGGTGVGTGSGTGEETRNSVVSSGIAWTRTGQLAPEIGYFLTPRFRLGVQARLQLVSGATPYHVPNAAPGECGSDNVCAPYKGAFAGLLKATWLLVAPESAFQAYVSLAAGFGNIRHVMKVSSPPTCGSSGAEACLDTVAAGPALFGPGIGFQYRVSDGIGLVAEIDGLVGAPHFTANADLNVGVAFQF
jgi:hypothetical protein